MTAAYRRAFREAQSIIDALRDDVLRAALAAQVGETGLSDERIADAQGNLRLLERALEYLRGEAER